MAIQIQLRRDTAANWTSTNPVLVQGEPGLETDTGKIKYGNGTSAWNSLAYQDATYTPRTSTTGAAFLPSGTTAQRDGSPATGYIRFNTSIGQFEGFNGSAWSSVGGGATGGGADRVFQENDNAVTTNYTLSTNRNAVTAGPVTVNSGVTVTIPSGSAWVIV